MVSISAASRLSTPKYLGRRYSGRPRTNCLPPLRAKAISIHLCGQATLLFSPSLVEIRSYFSGAISFLNCSLIQTSRRTTDFQHAPILKSVLLLNFSELEKCSGRSIGYGPTIETVRVSNRQDCSPDNRMILLRGCLRSALGADETGSRTGFLNR